MTCPRSLSLYRELESCACLLQDDLEAGLASQVTGLLPSAQPALSQRSLPAPRRTGKAVGATKGNRQLRKVTDGILLRPQAN